MPNINLVLPKEIGLKWDCEETGLTFFENALLKAESLYNLTGKPTLADDSGLCLPALNGAPGIYSARYGSQSSDKLLSDSERNQYLLDQIKDKEDRRAFFVCCMVYIAGPYRVFSTQETFEGELALAPSGGGGFGYDPLLYLEEYKKTVAELPEKVKNKISHRAKAAKRIWRLIDE